MKKTKIIIPALGLLVLSTAASVSGTVAWFSVNTSVSATGMKVQARAEAGLLISADKTDASWGNTDASDYSTGVALLPVSTNNFSTWYHAVSNSAANHQAASGYTQLAESGAGNIIVKQYNLASTTNALAQVTFADANSDDAYDSDDGDSAYYLMNRFYLKSSGDQIGVDGTNNWLSISKLTIAGIQNSSALDASLRVGVNIGSGKKILAPFAAAAGTGTSTGAITYNVGGSTATTAYKGTLAANGNYVPDVDTGFTGNIPAKTSDPINIDIYLWFEGEDVNCKSNNVVATLDTLTIDVEFSLVEVQPTNVAA